MIWTTLMITEMFNSFNFQGATAMVILTVFLVLHVGIAISISHLAKG